MPLQALTGSRKEIGDAPTSDTGHPLRSVKWRNTDTSALTCYVQWTAV